MAYFSVTDEMVEAKRVQACIAAAKWRDTEGSDKCFQFIVNATAGCTPLSSFCMPCHNARCPACLPLHKKH